MRLVLVIPLLLLTGCFGGGRIFQKEVPKPVVKLAPQVEAERRSADLIARYIKTPEELKPVATALSTSLGTPYEPIEVDRLADLPKAASVSTTELTAAVISMQKQIAALNKTLTKYQGKEIEGTGFSYLGPGMTAIVIGLIVLAVACPPALALMGFAYRRLKATAKIVVNEMEEAANAPETQEAVGAVKKRISKAMGNHKINTATLKAVVLDLKKPS
jgi:hypothetical protein